MAHIRQNCHPVTFYFHQHDGVNKVKGLDPGKKETSVQQIHWDLFWYHHRDKWCDIFKVKDLTYCIWAHIGYCSVLKDLCLNTKKCTTHMGLQDKEKRGSWDYKYFSFSLLPSSHNKQSLSSSGVACWSVELTVMFLNVTVHTAICNHSL